MSDSQDLFDAHRGRSTLRTKLESQALDDPELWGVERGRDVKLCEVGDKVISNGNGVIKAGIEMVVKEITYVNGFYRYLANGQYHLATDIEKVEE